MPEVLPVPGSASTFGVVSLLALAVAVAAVVAFFVVIKFSANREVAASNEGAPSFGTRFTGQSSDAGQQTSKGFEQSRPPFPRLTLTQGPLPTPAFPFPPHPSLTCPASRP